MADAPQGPIVFTEIPAADPARACSFYEALFAAPLIEKADGENPVWLFPHGAGAAPAGHVCPGTPASAGAGMTAHFVVRDSLEETMERVRQGGGEIVSEVIEIYSGAFFYATDSEGNSIGLFRYKD